jgi:pyridoxal phosphate enzyme (YggS family)
MDTSPVSKNINYGYSSHSEVQIRENYFKVLENIERAAQTVNRRASDISLVVVTKAQPLIKLVAVISAGVRKLGENYVDEAIAKIVEFNEISDLEWHMIGHIQSRKTRPVSENFHWIHSIDSVKVARRLNQHAGEVGNRLSILLEFNMSGEVSKFGWRAWDDAWWEPLVDEIRPVTEMENLDLKGLMTIPPLYDDPELSRPVYRNLNRLRDYFSTRYPTLDFRHLSMGMSSDYRIGIEEGATIIRVGTAIMGERQ